MLVQVRPVAAVILAEILLLEEFHLLVAALAAVMLAVHQGVAAVAMDTLAELLQCQRPQGLWVLMDTAAVGVVGVAVAILLALDRTEVAEAVMEHQYMQKLASQTRAAVAVAAVVLAALLQPHTNTAPLVVLVMSAFHGTNKCQ